MDVMVYALLASCKSALFVSGGCALAKGEGLLFAGVFPLLCSSPCAVGGPLGEGASFLCCALGGVCSYFHVVDCVVFFVK